MDEDFEFRNRYLDDDDGYGVDSTGIYSCGDALYGQDTTATIGGDCNDVLATINLGETEVCNNVDDDCSGVVDDGGAGALWYLDLDGDGFGDLNTPTASPSCKAPVY